MDDLETQLREQLAEIRRRADEEAAPIIEQLTAIEAAKPRVPMALLGQSLPQSMIEDMAAMHAKARAAIDALAHGTGVMLGEQHIPLKEFQPEPADETCQNGRESG